MGSARSFFQHSVTVVGYGTTNSGIPFWKFKNSWGDDSISRWGDNGYGKIRRGRGHCGFGSYWMQPLCNLSGQPGEVDETTDSRLLIQNN